MLKSIVLIIACVAVVVAQQEKSAEINYARDIEPIFKANCLACHGGGERMSGLSLESYAELMKGGTHGHAIISGESANSRLVQMIEGTVEPRMPLGGKLKPEEIKLIKAWVDAGAVNLAAAKGETPIHSASSAPAPPKIAPHAGVAAAVTALSYSPDGKTLAVGGFKEVRLFDCAQNKLLKTLGGMESAVRTLAYSPDGSRLAAGGGAPAQYGEIVIWDARTGAVQQKIKGHRDYIYALAFSPDGKILATSSYDRLVKFWDPVQGTELKTLKDHIDSVYGIAFSPDGRWLASASADRAIKIWDVATARRLMTLSDATDVVYAVAFHPSSKMVASGGADKVIRVWTLTDSGGTLVHSIIAHEDEILRVAFSPDGKFLASASADHTVKLWDVENERTIHTFEKQHDWAQSLAFSPDGKTIAVGGFDGAINLYDTANGKAILSPSVQAALNH